MPNHKRLRNIATSCLVAFLAGAAGATPASRSPKIPKRSGVVQDWDNRLQIAREHLNRSDFEQGRDVADAVLKEMIDRIEGGSGAGPGLGTTLLLRAFGEAGLGDMDKALWDWHTARAVDPGISKDRLSAFGPAGERLAAAVTSATQKETLQSLDATSGKSLPKGVSKPKKIAGDLPRYPLGARNSCIEGTLMMDAVIEEHGALREPGLLQPPDSPVLTVAAFEAVRTWRFKPALFEGKPVPVYYAFTTSFGIVGMKICPPLRPAALKNKKKSG